MTRSEPCLYSLKVVGGVCSVNLAIYSKLIELNRVVIVFSHKMLYLLFSLNSGQVGEYHGVELG